MRAFTHSFIHSFNQSISWYAIFIVTWIHGPCSASTKSIDFLKRTMHTAFAMKTAYCWNIYWRERETRRKKSGKQVASVSMQEENIRANRKRFVKSIAHNVLCLPFVAHLIWNALVFCCWRRSSDRLHFCCYCCCICLALFSLTTTIPSNGLLRYTMLGISALMVRVEIVCGAYGNALPFA